MNASVIGDLLVASFSQARIATPGLGERWISASARIGGLLPHSLIMVTVQRLGEIDALCRCLEREMEQSLRTGIDLRFNYYSLMADFWIGSAYSICYILNNRKLAVDKSFKRLTEDLRLIRVQLEKYEIPSDRDLDAPLEMTTGGSDTDAVPPRNFVYDKKDKRRAHIGRSGLSQRRSFMWEVLEINPMGQRWLERTELSDRFLQTFAPSAV